MSESDGPDVLNAREIRCSRDERQSDVFLQVNCPFHHDEARSLDMSFDTWAEGKWACHGCSRRGYFQLIGETETPERDIFRLEVWPALPT